MSHDDDIRRKKLRELRIEYLGEDSDDEEPTPITRENAWEKLMCALEFGSEVANEYEREVLLDILQNKDASIRDALAACLNEDAVIRAFMFFHSDYYGGHDVGVLQAFHDIGMSVDVKEDGKTALMLTSECGKTELVEMLLQKNANPDLQNNYGSTALMHASEFSHKEAVRVLLNHNADIALRNNDGVTALDLAWDEEIKEMIRNHVSTSYVLK